MRKFNTVRNIYELTTLLHKLVDNFPHHERKLELELINDLNQLLHYYYKLQVLLLKLPVYFITFCKVTCILKSVYKYF